VSEFSLKASTRFGQWPGSGCDPSAAPPELAVPDAIGAHVALTGTTTHVDSSLADALNSGYQVRVYRWPRGANARAAEEPVVLFDSAAGR
jgi:hypothetical protein